MTRKYNNVSMFDNHFFSILNLLVNLVNTQLQNFVTFSAITQSCLSCIHYTAEYLTYMYLSYISVLLLSLYICKTVLTVIGSCSY
jgi:hypothetical protein